MDRCVTITCQVFFTWNGLICQLQHTHGLCSMELCYMPNSVMLMAPSFAGCHVASCSRQDRFETATWARGAIDHQAQEDHNADQTYPLSEITDTLLSGEDGPDCHGMCNDEKLLPDESPHFYECWGHFKWV